MAVRRADRGERRRRPGLVDALVQDLADLAFLVGQHQFGVHGGVELAVAVVDLQAREPRVHAERAGLVRDDRHDARSNLLVPQQFLERAHGRHGGGDLLVARPLLERLVGVAAAAASAPWTWCGAPAGTRRARAAGRAGSGSPGPPGRGGSTAAGTGSPRAAASGIGMRWRVAEVLEVLQRKLFHLVGGVAALEVRAQRVALDGLGQDHRRLTLVLRRRAVGGVHLAVVVTAALEVPDLLVGHRSRPTALVRGSRPKKWSRT